MTVSNWTFPEVQPVPVQSLYRRLRRHQFLKMDVEAVLETLDVNSLLTLFFAMEDCIAVWICIESHEVLLLLSTNTVIMLSLIISTGYVFTWITCLSRLDVSLTQSSFYRCQYIFSRTTENTNIRQYFFPLSCQCIVIAVKLVTVNKRQEVFLYPSILSWGNR